MLRLRLLLALVWVAAMLGLGYMGNGSGPQSQDGAVKGGDGYGSNFVGEHADTPVKKIQPASPEVPAAAKNVCSAKLAKPACKPVKPCKVAKPCKPAVKTCKSSGICASAATATQRVEG